MRKMYKMHECTDICAVFLSQMSVHSGQSQVTWPDKPYILRVSYKRAKKIKVPKVIFPILFLAILWQSLQNLGKFRQILLYDRNFCAIAFAMCYCFCDMKYCYFLLWVVPLILYAHAFMTLYALWLSRAILLGDVAAKFQNFLWEICYLFLWLFLWPEINLLVEKMSNFLGKNEQKFWAAAPR